MNFKIEFQNRQQLDISQLNTNNSLNWLSSTKAIALEKFKSAILPNKKIEHWKYNEMSFLKDNQYSLSQKSSKEDVINLLENANKIQFNSAIELVIVDGFLMTNLENLPSIKGLKISLFENADLEQQQIILSHIDTEFNNKNILINLNEAINQNGILIEVDANQIIDKPVYIRQFTKANQLSSLSSQKLIFSIGQSSQITIIEEFKSSKELSEPFSLQQTSMSLAENTIVNHYRLNLENETTRQVSQVKKSLAKNSVINDFYLGLGSQFNRTDIDILYQGNNAEANLTGIYLPKNNQVIDYHTNIEHQVAHCKSNETFRGIIADQASATFNGKIHIFKDAQKSDAYLNNKNLLLTNQAEINTKPELEIYADDVVCAHGATVAQLDKKAMYYLQSRGIDQQQAKKILSVAFVQELLNKIKLEPVKIYLSAIVSQHLSQIK